jgi:3-oxoacyl-[acyl-carrier protein] reductase
LFSIDLTGKTAWVTGASRGIGAAIARALGQAGAQVAVSYRSKGVEAEAVVAAIEASGSKALAVPCDVADARSCEEAYQKIEAAFGKVDILVNNAGVIADNLFMMLEDSDWQPVLETNLMGGVRCTRLAMKGMMMRRFGRVINLSSVAATKAGRGQANYAASKGAIEAMTRSLAVEVGRRGVTINCIAPGVIETDMSADVRKLGEDEIMERLVIKRYGKSEEIAAWAVLLASEYGAYMTGQVVHIDGGLKMP